MHIRRQYRRGAAGIYDEVHTESNKQCQDRKISLEQVLLSFCMVFSLVL